MLAQTYTEWEAVLIDDGSTDATASIIKSYKDERLKYIHQQNSGIEALSHTYNRALSIGRGELIGILEGDDTWPPEKLEKLVPAFVNQDVVLAYGIPREINASGEVSSVLPRQVRKKLKLPKEVLFNDPVGTAAKFMLRADGHELVAPATVVIRRRALEVIGGFQYVPKLCTTDFPTFFKLAESGRFQFTPDVMGYRRRHPNSAVFAHLDEISEASRQFAGALLAKWEPRLTRAELKSIRSSWTKTAGVADFSRGRLELLRGRWRAGRDFFLQAMCKGDLRTRIAAGIGWTLSWSHCSLEPVFRMAGRSELELPR